MATATRTLMAAMMMVAGSTQLVSAQDAQLTVHVRNDANVPTDVLASAQLSLMAIYANAGIQVSLVEKDADFLVVLLRPDGPLDAQNPRRTRDCGGHRDRRSNRLCAAPPRDGHRAGLPRTGLGRTW